MLLEPKFSHTFSFADGHLRQWSRVDAVWDDRICTATVQFQEDSDTQIITLAVLDILPDAVETRQTLRRSVHIMKDPYGNHIFHSGRYGKTLIWNAYSGKEDVDFIIQFAGRPGLADVQDEDCREIQVMNFIPPDFIHEHGDLYDVDFDDGCGRLAMYMEDGTIFVFEFI
jgi:hypothetical protein